MLQLHKVVELIFNKIVFADLLNYSFIQSSSQSTTESEMPRFFSICSMTLVLYTFSQISSM